MTDPGPFPTLDFVERGGTWSAIELVAAAERYPADYLRATGHDPRWVKVYGAISPLRALGDRKLVIEVAWRGVTYGEVFFYDDARGPSELAKVLDRMVQRLDQEIPRAEQ